jgi:hypothetical protein
MDSLCESGSLKESDEKCGQGYHGRNDTMLDIDDNKEVVIMRLKHR